MPHGLSGLASSCLGSVIAGPGLSVDVSPGRDSQLALEAIGLVAEREDTTDGLRDLACTMVAGYQKAVGQETL